jgi:hypothetical protein
MTTDNMLDIAKATSKTWLDLIGETELKLADLYPIEDPNFDGWVYWEEEQPLLFKPFVLIEKGSIKAGTEVWLYDDLIFTATKFLGNAKGRIRIGIIKTPEQMQVWAGTMNNIPE